MNVNMLRCDFEVSRVSWPKGKTEQILSGGGNIIDGSIPREISHYFYPVEQTMWKLSVPIRQ